MSMSSAFNFGGSWETTTPPTSKARFPYPAPNSDFQLAKAQADTANSPFWRLYNKYYDLTDYLDKHPGGRQWLEYTRGTDCTEAFEAHHLDFSKVERILKIYYVKDAEDGGYAEDIGLQAENISTEEKDDNYAQPVTGETIKEETRKENGIARGRALLPPSQSLSEKKAKGEESKKLKSSRTFLYDEKSFYPELRRRVVKVLLSKTGASTVMEATGPTTSMKAACAIVISQFLIVHYMAARTGSKVLSSLAGLLLVGCWGVGHNFMHQSDMQCSYWRCGIDLTPFSSEYQRMTHALSHHIYTNLHTDWECYNSDDLLAFLPGIGKNVNAAVRKSYPFLLSLAGIESIVQKFSMFARLVKEKGFNGLTLGEKALMLPMAQIINYVRFNGVKNGAKLFFIQMGVFMMYFVPAGLSVHHSLREEVDSKGNSVPDSWHAGMPGEQHRFGEHQMVATSDHTVWLNNGSFLGNYLSLVLFAFLNDHTAHHLFPSVDHSKHSLYRDVMLNTFKEYGIPYSSNNFLTLFRGFHRFVQQRTVSELSKDISTIG